MCKFMYLGPRSRKQVALRKRGHLQRIIINTDTVIDSNFFWCEPQYRRKFRYETEVTQIAMAI